MAEAMKGATKVMMRLNSQVNIPGLQKIMMEFEKQSEVMDMKASSLLSLSLSLSISLSAVFVLVLRVFAWFACRVRVSLSSH